MNISTVPVARKVALKHGFSLDLCQLQRDSQKEWYPMLRFPVASRTVQRSGSLFCCRNHEKIAAAAVSCPSHKADQYPMALSK